MTWIFDVNEERLMVVCHHNIHAEPWASMPRCPDCGGQIARPYDTPVLNSPTVVLGYPPRYPMLEVMLR